MTKKKEKPITHDYLKHYWGHDYTFEPRDGGIWATMMGWGNDIHTGDLLLIGTPPQIAWYKVNSIKYFANPPDMWKATVKFVPHDSKQTIKALKELGIDPETLR